MPKTTIEDQIIKEQIAKQSSYWMQKRESNSLRLFHEASQRVPAYKDFLKKNKVQAHNIKTWEHFIQLPPIDKNNYLRQYPIDSLCWDGKLNTPMVYTATSGSTGSSVYFLRNHNVDWQYSVIVESFIKQSTSPHEPTLLLVCFGMGIWIGGLITYQAFEIATRRCDFPVSIITPGISKKEIFKALQNIAPHYKQLIFAGYPPFIKDILDDAEDNGVNLKKYKVRLLFAAEAISEEYRDYVSEKAGIENMYKDIMSIYGSADLGAMAHETLVSTLMRRIARNNKKLFAEIFPDINKTPTLAQFNPDFINFEDKNGEILITGNSAMPLVRYGIGDNGGVFSFEEAAELIKKSGTNLTKEISIAGISDCYYKLPFVYVYERKDLSTTFYGLWIYPEWIRPALFNGDVRDYITGKFTLLTKYDKNKNQFLELNIELRKNKKPTKILLRLLERGVVEELRKSSSEYQELLNHLKRKAVPEINFWPAEDPTYFAPGIKQKWILKNT